MSYPRCRWIAALSFVALSGCVPQLPQNDVIPIDSIPTFDASAIVSSKNGIIASDISRVPGTICVPAASGLCELERIRSRPIFVRRSDGRSDGDHDHATQFRFAARQPVHRDRGRTVPVRQRFRRILR